MERKEDRLLTKSESSEKESSPVTERKGRMVGKHAVLSVVGERWHSWVWWRCIIWQPLRGAQGGPIPGVGREAGLVLVLVWVRGQTPQLQCQC